MRIMIYVGSVSVDDFFFFLIINFKTGANNASITAGKLNFFLALLVTFTLR